jgi:hypothetical protein
MHAFRASPATHSVDIGIISDSTFGTGVSPLHELHGEAVTRRATKFFTCTIRGRNYTVVIAYADGLPPCNDLHHQNFDNVCKLLPEVRICAVPILNCLPDGKKDWCRPLEDAERVIPAEWPRTYEINKIPTFEQKYLNKSCHFRRQAAGEILLGLLTQVVEKRWNLVVCPWWNAEHRGHSPVQCVGSFVAYVKKSLRGGRAVLHPPPGLDEREQHAEERPSSQSGPKRSRAEEADERNNADPFDSLFIELPSADTISKAHSTRQLPPPLSIKIHGQTYTLAPIGAGTRKGVWEYTDGWVIKIAFREPEVFDIEISMAQQYKAFFPRTIRVGMHEAYLVGLQSRCDISLRAFGEVPITGEKADQLYDRLRQATHLLRTMLLVGLSPSDVSVDNIGFSARHAYMLDYEGGCQRSLQQHLQRLFDKNEMVSFKPAAEAIVTMLDAGTHSQGRVQFAEILGRFHMLAEAVSANTVNIEETEEEPDDKN